MIVLGLNAYHADAAACCSRRQARRRGRGGALPPHQALGRLPDEAIRYCLREAGVALATSTTSRSTRTRAPTWAQARVPGDAAAGPRAGARPDPQQARARRRRRDAGARAPGGDSARRGASRRAPPRAPGVGVLSRRSTRRSRSRSTASATSPARPGASGRGERGRGRRRVYFPHSLGIFYQALTQFLGFPHYGDEYKVMGLAPYGEPDVPAADARARAPAATAASARPRLLPPPPRRSRLRMGRRLAGRRRALFTPRSPSCSGPARAPDEPLTQRHHDIARSMQAMYEEAFFHLLAYVHQRYRVDALCSGRRLRDELGRQRQGLRSARRSAGCTCRRRRATPAARSARRSSVWHGARAAASSRRWRTLTGARNSPTPRSTRVLESQRGATWPIAACSRHRCRRPAAAARPRRPSREGEVVGWFQGRMEWGPRALGNRSIVCDPRRADMKDILNPKIKRRESFRPFAPSVLREAVGRVVRDRRRRAVHDAGLSDPRRQARADPGGDARRRHRAACRP